ncbi:hypothetical protein [Microbacterium gilvum]|uniref:Uncharacterized protein n=1 Tax=Microbacterium gilvum TaxID=1336204 RepID=A0ABP8ZQC8_9MICO
MPITSEVTITLASVEITDTYRVALTTRKKSTDLSVDDARQLAAELIAAADQVDEALADMLATFDEEGRFEPIPSDQWPELAVEGDPLPISPDCEPGKHSACTGDAWDDVKDVPAPCSCACHEAGEVTR